MNESLKELAKKKQIAKITKNRRRTEEAEEAWKEMKKQVKRESLRLKKSHYSKRIVENKGNPNKLFKIMREIAPSNFGNKEPQTKMDKQALNKLNKFFATTGSRICEEINNEKPSTNLDLSKLEVGRPIKSKLDEIKETTEENITKLINKIDGNKATGIDGIPIKLIKLAVHILAKPIEMITNKIIATRTFPQEFKTAIVTPAFKKGDPNQADNYRPLSILPNISKLTEYVIKNQIYNYMEENDLLSVTQHAFREGYSTTTCLLKLTEDIRKEMDKGKATGILAIDLSKAFDSIDHKILIQKLEKYGFTGQIMDILKDYLRGRKQFVKQNEIISDEQQLTHGVPQGSILGPLLFSIYVNDIKDVVKHCKILNYADDTTIYYSSSHPSNIQIAINQDIRNLERWFSTNKMKLNEKKSEFMKVHPTNTKNKYENIHISVKGKYIQHSQHLKILGVNISENLKWDRHINNTIKNCKYQLRSFRRAAAYINEDEKKLLYNSCIASRLSYADIIWKETTARMKTRLQVIQNESARIILMKKPRESAKPLLKELGWLNLEKKRQLHAEVLLHKIQKGNAPTALEEMLNEYKRSINTNTRQGRCEGLTYPGYRTNIMTNSYFISTIKTWNKLPIEIRETKTSNNFKSKLNAKYQKDAAM